MADPDSGLAAAAAAAACWKALRCGGNGGGYGAVVAAAAVGPVSMRLSRFKLIRLSEAKLAVAVMFQYHDTLGISCTWVPEYEVRGEL